MLDDGDFYFEVPLFQSLRALLETEIVVEQV